MAVAIANMQKSGIEIALPNINDAEYGFAADVNNNRIMYSLKAISKVGAEVAREILTHRKFTSMEDFYERMIATRIITPAKMIQLVKAGCFVELDYPDRRQTLENYIRRFLFTPVQQLTFTHLNNMVELGIISDDRMKDVARVPAFAKYVVNEKNVVKRITTTTTKRKLPQCGYYDRHLVLDGISQPFFRSMFTEESIIGIRGEYLVISEKKFLKECDRLKAELAEWFNQPQIIEAYNEALFHKNYDEHLLGSIGSWEMDALSFYHGVHELAHVQNDLYGIEDFYELPEKPMPYDHYPRYINKEKKWFAKFKISRIAGTVVDSNNDKHFVTLLTTSGIVLVKFSKGHYVFYNQTISVLDQATGKKTTIDSSWFKRGTKIIVCGYRNEDDFRAYRYADTIYTHIVSKIEKIGENGILELKTERAR